MIGRQGLTTVVVGCSLLITGGHMFLPDEMKSVGTYQLIRIGCFFNDGLKHVYVLVWPLFV